MLSSNDRVTFFSSAPTATPPQTAASALESGPVRSPEAVQLDPIVNGVQLTRAAASPEASQPFPTTKDVPARLMTVRLLPVRSTRKYATQTAILLGARVRRHSGTLWAANAKPLRSEWG